MGGRPRRDALDPDLVILVDTSAWVEFLRRTGSPTNQEVRRLLPEDTAVCDAVRMEVLAGARSEAHLRELDGLLGRSTLLLTQPEDYDAAAALHRSCRQSGETVRRLLDCLIAAVAIRHDVPVLAADADYEVLSRHTALAVHRPGRRR